MKLFAFALMLLFLTACSQNTALREEAYMHYKLSKEEGNIESARSWAADIIKYGPGTDQAKEAEEYLKTSEVLLKDKAVKKKQESEAKAGALKQDSAKLNEALKNFRKDKDEFSDAVTYYPKGQSTYWPQRLTLQAHVEQDGTLWVISNYFANDWIFHKSVIAKVNGQTTSMEVSGSSNSVQEVADGGNVFERNSYSGNGDFMKAIFESNEKTIKIRFEGEQFHEDAVLTAADIKALKNCYELHMILSKLSAE